MQGSDEAYEELIRRIEERFVPLAVQIREEVARGRWVQGAELPESERQERQVRLVEAKLGRLGRDDMAVVAYTGDERLALLCQSLLTLAQTMTESRRALLEPTTDHDLPHTRTRFTEPDETDPTEFDLTVELSAAEHALEQVASLLGRVQEKAGIWP